MGTRPVRVHWWMLDDRPICLYDAPAAKVAADKLVQLPYCGACVLVLDALGVRPERLFSRCQEPDIRPSEARELLRGTFWEDQIRLNGEDLWWFEATRSTVEVM